MRAPWYTGRVSGWQIGHIRIDRVLEFERPLFEPRTLLPAADPATIESHREWLEPALLDPATGLLVLAFHTFVIRTPRRTILVDTCSGNDKPRPGKPRYHERRWPYLERLATLGVAPDDVDVVVCTHLHVDHVGWNTRLVDGRWVPTFPRARYLFAAAEWRFWREEYGSARFRDDPYHEDSLLPVFDAGQVVLVDGDHRIDDGVWLEPTPGHTPGHVAVRVASGGQEAVMTGDLMHHPLQCAEPDWSSCFCVDPAGSARTRRAVLERYAGTPTLVLPAHFPTPAAGRIVRAGTGFRFVFDERRA
jgi:glyoxylase-like metal-dependent hydrolase (beta-lactamase superfamily II)